MASVLSAIENKSPAQEAGAPIRMVYGITSDQTCMVLTGRLRRLKEAGFEITLIASPGLRLEETAAREGVAFYPVRMERGISPLADLRSLFLLLIALWRIRPTITDFSTPKAGLLGNVAAWMLGVPHRVYTLRGLKLESSRGWKHALLLISERIAAGCAHVVLCNSESLRVEAKALRLTSDAKLCIVGEGSSNGVDVERFCPGPTSVREQLKIDSEDLVIGFVGRLTSDKGVPELLVSFAEVLKVQPRARLLLVGWFDRSEDALDSRSRATIAEHPRIHHVGFVAEPVEYYRAMDIFVLPTHREGFPNAVLEAACTALPVITTESTGARDAVLAEVTGLLIPAGIPEAITEAVVSLADNPSLRRRMGNTGRAWVMDRFCREKVLDLAAVFYRDLARGGGRVRSAMGAHG